MARVTNVTRQEVLAEHAEVARGFGERLKGLLGRRGWHGLDGLWIEPCAGVHGMGMRFAIDVLTVDGGMSVLAVETLRPWRLGRIHLDAAAVLEVPEGTANRTGTRAGDVIAIDEHNDSGASVDTGGGRW